MAMKVANLKRWDIVDYWTVVLIGELKVVWETYYVRVKARVRDQETSDKYIYTDVYLVHNQLLYF